MTHRYFEGQDHAKVYADARPTPPETLIKRLVELLQEEYNGPLSLAVDLGCGSGQCTFALGKEFSSVLGTDISPAQISQATDRLRTLKCENVNFQTFPAEEIPVADRSVQLITICVAAHWMDLPKVFDEARRVLCPNGVLAIIGYQLPVYTVRDKEDQAKNDAIKEVMGLTLQRLMKYWPERALTNFTEYANVVIPFSDNKRERGYPSLKIVSLDSIENMVRSYSPFLTLCKEEGDNAGNEVVKNMKEKIKTILNEGRKMQMTPKETQEYEFIETTNYFFLASRA